ncbi:hypothetical protein M565_ctg5P1433 [Vibrio cyclitrophicus FF75]|nr:hypothetical protein M565_ctg5P1433 [Vibrio cyclitrophicus FF75]
MSSPVNQDKHSDISFSIITVQSACSGFGYRSCSQNISYTNRSK